jgi:peptidoglycan hydrolase-like protein with peptidoglycan-binding domain
MKRALVLILASAAVYGDTGALSLDIMRKVEDALAAQGYDPGPVDGKWTAKSATALKQAQRDRELEPTGVLDQRTLAAIGIRDEENPFMQQAAGAAAGGTRPR